MLDEAILSVSRCITGRHSDARVQCQLQVRVRGVKTDANIESVSQFDRCRKLPDRTKEESVAKEVHVQGEVSAANSRITRVHTLNHPVAVHNGGVK